jgi:PAS domain S-box-containing protein
MYTCLVKANTDLQKIFDSSLDVICTIDAEEKFVTISAASIKLWGYNPDELTGRNYLAIVAEEDHESTKHYLQLVKQDASVNGFENNICKKDGTKVSTAWSAYWNEEDGLMYCVARGTKKIEEVEKSFHESEEQLRFAQRLAKIGSWYFDLLEGKITWSDGLYEVYGVDKKTYPQPALEFFFDLVYPDEREKVQEEIQNLITTGRSDYVHRMVRPDGKLIYLRHLSQTVKNAKGEAIALNGIAQDITEQKEAEIKLAVSEQKFKSLVQNGSDIIVVMDENGIMKYASPSTSAVAGYEPDELIGRNAFEFIHPEDAHIVKLKLGEVINSTNDGMPTPHRFLAKDGKWIWLESKGNNLMREANIEGIVINARNITERKKLEKQLENQQKKRQRDITSAVIKAQESERSQLGQELHDNVNQVITTVKLYNEMLLDGIGDPKEILQKSIHHLQSCINEIRSISKRLSAPTLGKISLEDSIKELVDSINLTNRLHISFSITGVNKKIIPQDFHLTIYRIIQEQLNNIIKYAEARQVLVIIKNCGEGLYLQIEDDGKGFDTKAKRKGIGITNMETRAENMHGKLEIISAPGKGCKLVAKFPSINADASK